MICLSHVAIIVGCIALILGIVSRVIVQPLVVEAQAFLQFGQACFLFAIAILVGKVAKEKK